MTVAEMIEQEIRDDVDLACLHEPDAVRQRFECTRCTTEMITRIAESAAYGAIEEAGNWTGTSWSEDERHQMVAVVLGKKGRIV